MDHLDLLVSDFARSRDFYRACVTPLGFHSEEETASQVIFKNGDKRGDFYFWLHEGRPYPCHFAFLAQTREQVDEFYTAALANGGQDNGAPGLRPNYEPNYYAAFVIDPDGYRIEAVCHTAE